MGRRADRRFRPSLHDEALEDRTPPSHGQWAAPADHGGARGVPRLSRRTVEAVYSQIDYAFADYRGKATGSAVAAGLAGALVGLVAPAASDPSADDPGQGDGYSDYPLLMSRLRAAVGKLPYGADALFPAVSAKFDAWVVTPENARGFQDWLKVQVRRHVVAGTRDGRFAPTGF